MQITSLTAVLLRNIKHQAILFMLTVEEILKDRDFLLADAFSFLFNFEVLC